MGTQPDETSWLIWIAVKLKMSSQTSLDPQLILASLGVNDISQAERVTGGADTSIWKVMWRNQLYALRVFRADQIHTYEREVVAMTVARENRVSVPEIVRHGMWQDRPVLFLTWLDGQTLAAALQTQPHRIWQVGIAFGRAQASIHQVATPPDMNSTDWIEWAGDEPELKDHLYHLSARKTALLHLDYHPLNVMVHNSAISGILDWANARAGDPRADFARTYTILRIEPRQSLSLKISLWLLARCWQRGYIQGGGNLDDMAVFYAWAGAVMIRDLSPRINNPDFGLLDEHLNPVRIWRDKWKHQAGIST